MWFICDALGISLLTVTWVLLFFADWVVVKQILWSLFHAADRSRLPWLPLNDAGLCIFVVYQTLIFLSWFSHFRAATTDPGTVTVAVAPEGIDNPRCCKLCGNRWKPPRAHHCKTCQRCIFRMDHHCPWINNCVGMNNQKIFILFLGYTALSAIVTLLILIGSALRWIFIQPNWGDAPTPSSSTLICSGVVAVVCLAAVLFVMDFFQEQIESIQMNSTLVETYQRTHGVRTSFGDHFRGIFGPRIWLWLWPAPSAPPPDYQEPAIPDDLDPLSLEGESESLGIAGLESEELSEGAATTLRQRPTAGVAAAHAAS